MTENQPRVWYSTERTSHGKATQLVSIGMVRERAYGSDEADTLYLINNAVDLNGLRGSQLAHLPVEEDQDFPGYWWWNPAHADRKYLRPLTGLSGIRLAVAQFITCGPEPRNRQLRGYKAAADHVALTRLLDAPDGEMPQGVPDWTYDLRQRQADLGVPDDELPQPVDGTGGHALADAWYAKQIDDALAEAALDRRKPVRPSWLYGPHGRLHATPDAS